LEAETYDVDHFSLGGLVDFLRQVRRNKILLVTAGGDDYYVFVEAVQSFERTSSCSVTAYVFAPDRRPKAVHGRCIFARVGLRRRKYRQVAVAVFDETSGH
jgi:hypothetical protein